MNQPKVFRALALLAALPPCACVTSPRAEKNQLHELSLHAYDEGRRFAEVENYSVALDRFTRSATIHPQPAAYHEAGRMHETLGDREAAAVAYMTALQMAPDFSEARLGLMGLDFEVPSEEELRAGPEVLERFSEGLLREVELRRIARDEDKTGLTPEEIHARREKLLRRMERASERRMPTPSEVRAVLFTGEDGGQDLPSATAPRYPDDVATILNTYPFHFAQGIQLQKQNNFERAVEEYQQALAADPNRLEARLNLGDCLLRLERHPPARFHYKLAREQFPDSGRPLLKLGNYYDSLSRPDDARRFYLQALDQEPDYVKAINNLAAIAIREDDFSEAIGLLTRATTIDPGYALGYLNLGIARENQGNRTEALEAYRRYIDLGGDRAPEVRRWIAEME